MDTITFDRADMLRDELSAYPDDAELFDSTKVSEALAQLALIPKQLGAPKIVFDGADYRRRLQDEEAQHALF